MKEIRVLLVDDQEIVRRGLRGMLEHEEDIEVTSDCASAEEALEQAKIISPNILLMEVNMSGMSGIEATRLYCQKRMPGSIIMLTLCKDRLAEAMEAGAVGYLLKDIKSEELARAIRRVYNGELVIDERFTLQGVEEGSEYLSQGCDRSGTLVKEAELIILSPVDAIRLLRFTSQVEGVLEASVLQQVGSWNNGTIITIRLQKITPLLNVLDKLVNMTDVDEVSEETTGKSNPTSHLQKSMAKLRVRPRRKFTVTLKPISQARESESARTENKLLKGHQRDRKEVFSKAGASS